MKLLKVFLIFALIAVSHGCENKLESSDDIEQSKLLVEVEALTKYGVNIHDSKLDEIIEKYNHAVNMARAMGNQKIELYCLIRLLEIHDEAEEYRLAIDTGNEAMELAIELDDLGSLADIYKLIAINYYNLASYTKAFENLEIALQLYTEMNDTLNIQDVLNLQGNVFFSYNDFDRAYSYYEKNLELSKTRNDKIRIAKAMTNLGLIYSYKSGNSSLTEDSAKVLSDMAIDHIKKGLLIIDETDETITKAEILYNLSDEYRSKGDFENALQSIREAINISDKTSGRVYIWSNTSYANILIDLDSLDHSKRILLSILKLAEESDLKESLIHIHSLLSEIYTYEKDYENALIHHVKESELSESIFSQAQKNQIDAIKIASEIETKERQKQAESKLKFYRTIIIIFLLLLVLIIVFHFYSRLRQKNKNVELENKLLNDSLEARNRELTTRIMALIQRNEIEKEMVLKLNRLKLRFKKKENQQEVQDIVRSLSFKQDDQLWKEFEIRFESIHQEFFNKLASSYPELTTNEKRLCAFLYLDMSSKDISAITGQSIRALNVARTRLRKRFDLTNDTQSISAFLNSL